MSISQSVRSVILLLLISSLFVPAFFISNVHAETTAPQSLATTTVDTFDEEPLPQAPANTVSCFDHYAFGSVQANLHSEVAGVVSGTSIVFTGTLENKNPYPVVDGALYVKVFRTRTTEKDVNGPDVVDQFLAVHDVVIPAKGSVPVSFTWRVPSNARSGDYQLATFFTTSRKFNLLGLSFTDDVVGNTVPFSVSGEQTTGVQFDKAKATVNGLPYHFAAFPPYTSKADPVDVTGVITNTTNSAQSARLSWVVYQWDGQLRENVVHEETQNITIPAKKSITVTTKVTDAKYPVYLAVGTVTWKDTKSIIGVRFVRPEVNRTRINFPSISAYPLVAGQTNSVFSCLHNSGEAHLVPGGKLELTLSDMSGKQIHSYVYDGDVTGAMMGVLDKFVPAKNYDRFTLDARLYQNGEFVDEAHLEYDCEKLAPGSCAPLSAQTDTTLGFFDFLMQNAITTISAIALFLVVVLGLGWMMMRSSKPNPETVTKV